MFEEHLLDVCLQRSVFTVTFSRYSRRMQQRPTEPGSPRIRNFGKNMCQDQLLDVFLGDKHLRYIVFRVIPE